MQTLQVSRRIITILGMCSLPNGRDICSSVTQIITMILELVLLIQLDWFSACYVVDHLKRDDVRSSTFALMQVIAIFATIASFISLIYHRKSVCHFFDRIQSIVEQCKFREREKNVFQSANRRFHHFSFSNFQINLLHQPSFTWMWINCVRHLWCGWHCSWLHPTWQQHSYPWLAARCTTT